MALQTENLSSQIDGATNTFTTTLPRVVGTLTVFYDTDRVLSYSEPDNQHVVLTFVPALGHVLFVQYDSTETYDGRVVASSTDPSGIVVSPTNDLDAILATINNRLTALENSPPGSSPTGTAGGVLSGTYPNPGFAVGATLPPSGAAGGDLTGTYPNPTINPSVFASVSGQTAIYSYGAGVILKSPVYLKSNGEVGKADSTSITTMPCIGFVDQIDYPASGQCSVRFSGVLTGLSGLSTGELYIVSKAGALILDTDSANPDYPKSSGNIVQVVGVAASSTSLQITISSIIGV